MAGKQRKKRRKKSNNWAASLMFVLIIIVAVLVMCYSGYKIFGTMQSYKVAGDAYKEIDSVFTGEISDTGDPGFAWDYDKLLELCADGVGYIYQPGVMSYPIVQAEDNDKYLRTMMNGEYNIAGTIFVDARFPEGMEGKYSIVYGHNMYNDSMFGPLTRYEEQDYYKEHPFFDIYIGYKHYRYYVFSSFVASAEGYVYSFDLFGDDFKAQFDRLRADSLYDTDVRELNNDDHVIVLSTCVDWKDYNYRNVVCLVRGEEITD